MWAFMWSFFSVERLFLMTSGMAFSEERIPKDMSYDEIGLCCQNALISVDSKLNTSGGFT